MTLIFVEMSANAADIRAGLYPTTSLDTALTPAGTGVLP
jgi:hypothetical protein